MIMFLKDVFLFNNLDMRFVKTSFIYLFNLIVKDIVLHYKGIHKYSFRFHFE